MPNLLCFGDSNTHGTVPMATLDDNNRFGSDTRWPTVAAAALGDDWNLLEEGLPGRTWCFDDPLMGGHMNGEIGLKIALGTHKPLDLVVIMLGTNDVKSKFAATPEEIARQAGRALDYCLQREIQDAHRGLKPILICPPPALERGCLAEQFTNSASKGPRLAALYAAQAKARGAAFFDAGTVIQSSSVDGVHFDAASHLALGAAIADFLRTI